MASTGERRTFMSRPFRIALVVLVAGLTGAVLVLALDRPRDTETKTVIQATVTTPQPGSAASLESVAADASAGVVSILATQTVESTGSPFEPPTSQEAVVAGSGFVLDKNGFILTSQHIISGATAIHISFAGGQKVHAKLVAADPFLDLAVLSADVPAAALHPLALGSADDLKLGQPVVAIGNPFGLDRSVSIGVVSALHRSMVASNGFTVSNAVQTDTPINHGNSGGPLLDASGRVVGVAAQIADSGVDANVGVAFAVAFDQPTLNAIASMEKGVTVRHAWLGVSLEDIDAILATSGRVPVESGALITGIVAGGPAAKAGLTGGSQIASVDGASYCVGGDVVTAIDGRAVANATAVQAALSAAKPGGKVRVTVVHANGKKAEVKVTLASQPTSAPETTTGCQ